MDVFKVRQARVRELIQTEHAGVQARFAAQIGRDANYVSRMLSNKAGRKNIGEELARLIEKRYRRPAGWLDGLDMAPQQVKEPTMLYGVQITEDGVRLGHEWDKLDEPLRSQIRVMIETLVAKQVRDRRKKRPADSQTEEPRLRT